MLPKIRPVFTEKKYLRIFLGTTAASFVFFLLLTLSFPWSQFLFFNYFLKDAVGYVVLTLIIISAFSLTLGLATSWVAYRFKTIIGRKLYGFFGIVGAFYIIAYILMLANTSYSLFSYTEMNGFPYTLANFLLLAPILPLTGILIVNVYTTVRNVRSGVSGAGGLAAGLFSMGCPTCGALLLPLLGIAAGLAVFPLRGLEVRLFSLGLLVLAASKLNLNTYSCNINNMRESKVVKKTASRHFFSKKFENIMLIAIILTAGLLIFNHMQILGISASLTKTGAVTGTSFSGSSSELSDADVSDVSSTAMSVATVFPELKDAKNEQDIMAIMLTSGTPEYSEALGGITFDDPVNSLNYLAKWYYSLKDEVKQNDPETWQRYLDLAAAPRGISCEYCCGVGPQGIDEQGELRCGCKHNPAAQAVALGLMEYTDYSDAEILREVMKWKTLWFPKNMVALGVQVAGQDPSQLKDLPGMVGGC